jgi:hypothetical protein
LVSAGQEIHAGRTDDASNEGIVGIFVDLERLVGLFDASGPQNHDLVRSPNQAPNDTFEKRPQAGQRPVLVPTLIGECTIANA